MEEEPTSNHAPRPPTRVTRMRRWFVILAVIAVGVAVVKLAFVYPAELVAVGTMALAMATGLGLVMRRNR